MTRTRLHEVNVFGPKIPDAENVAKKFGIRLHQFEKWEMGRYAKLRGILANTSLIPFFSNAWLRRGQPGKSLT